MLYEKVHNYMCYLGCPMSSVTATRINAIYKIKLTAPPLLYFSEHRYIPSPWIVSTQDPSLEISSQEDASSHKKIVIREQWSTMWNSYFVAATISLAAELTARCFWRLSLIFSVSFGMPLLSLIANCWGCPSRWLSRWLALLKVANMPLWSCQPLCGFNYVIRGEGAQVKWGERRGVGGLR